MPQGSSDCLSLDTQLHRVATPLSIAGELVYTYSPYDDPGSFYRWKIGDKDAEKVGELTELTDNIRGMRNGSFLAVYSDKYSIISPDSL